VTVAVLDERRPVLGGSTIAAAAGIDPYCSPIRLWLELTGKLQREESAPMRIGKALEPAIFTLFKQDGYDVTRTPDAEVRDPFVPWLVGHPDGFGAGEWEGAVIEAKATGRPTDTLPVHHEAQVQTYMRLSGAGNALVGQLGGMTFQTWHVEYHPHLADLLLALGEEFVRHVREGVQPAPHGHPDDRDALLSAYTVEPGGRVRETREVRDWRRELAGLLEAEKARKARIELLRARITAHMGSADTLVSLHDEVVATWKETPSRRLDVTRLRAERPDVYDAYTGETMTRRFLLK
jgi:predicted phage-related endonuclease